MSVQAETETQWHMVTIRFGTKGPLDVSKLPRGPLAPQHALGKALLEVLGTGQEIVIDDVHLVRADVPR